ncbi:retrovirus-related Pol polyprotein from transposon TNT 1-94, partial [Trifolium medium]|nr:retrovirus-related Pol polyprotein from transposon TNT 1-94 [Trifolium medium]
MISNIKLSKFGTDALSDATEFRSIVGALQYVTLTKPDIAFCFNKMCQYLARPLLSHSQAVKRILRYLLHIFQHGLLLQLSSAVNKFSIRAYSDSDWAKVKYRALAHTTSELMWIQSLLLDLHIPIHTPVLLCDNVSAVLISHNPVLHARTKDLELDIHFVREKVVAKTLNVQHVPGDD